MPTFNVQSFWQQRTALPIPPDSYIYIQQARKNANLFRIDPATGAVVCLHPNAGAWVPVNESLSVATEQQYVAFWMPRSQTLNFPTQVLVAVLNPDPTSPYRLIPSADDARQNRILVPAYEPITVSATDLDGPGYYAPGLERQVTMPWTASVNFWWQICWDTNATSGYIVQEVTTSMDAYDYTGRARPGGNHYWEAWKIAGPHRIVPDASDYWSVETGRGTRGTWTKTSQVYWAPYLRSDWNFDLDPRCHTAPATCSAGELVSTTRRPEDLGTPLLTRQIGGRWDGCQGSYWLNTHVASR